MSLRALLIQKEIKPILEEYLTSLLFESFVNSERNKTIQGGNIAKNGLRALLIQKEIKLSIISPVSRSMFESFVNSERNKTRNRNS